jgi:hypothetical protein
MSAPACIVVSDHGVGARAVWGVLSKRGPDTHSYDLGAALPAAAPAGDKERVARPTRAQRPELTDSWGGIAACPQTCAEKAGPPKPSRQLAAGYQRCAVPAWIVD